MSEKPPPPTQATAAPPSVANSVTSTKRVPGRPWPKGVSGNPSGRPKVEPRVRRYARRYDQRMVRVLASIAENPKETAEQRRKAAMDLIAIGSGRPATTQELIGRPDAPIGPLVNINLGNTDGRLTGAQARQIIREGRVPPAMLEAAESVLHAEAAAFAPVPTPEPKSNVIELTPRGDS